MEYCIGGSIIDIIRFFGQPLDNEYLIASILHGVLKGLEYLHANKKIHRDIKAGNILLDHSGNVKIADFGVSTELLNTFSNKDTVIGTPFWMSPEVIAKSKYNKKTDIWSLGITSIEIAEGQPPYSHIHPIRAMFAIKNSPPQSLSEPNKWSMEFNNFVSRCLTLDPKKRPNTKELLNDPFILKKNKGKKIIQNLIQQKMLALNEQTQNKKDQNESCGVYDPSIRANETGTMIEKPEIFENNNNQDVYDGFQIGGTVVIHEDDDDKENYDAMNQDLESEYDNGTMIVKTEEIEIVDPHEKTKKLFLKKGYKEESEQFPEELRGLSIKMIEENIKVINYEKERELNLIKMKYENILKKHEIAIKMLKKEKMARESLNKSTSSNKNYGKPSPQNKKNCNSNVSNQSNLMQQLNSKLRDTSNNQGKERNIYALAIDAKSRKEKEGKILKTQPDEREKNSKIYCFDNYFKSNNIKETHTNNNSSFCQSKSPKPTKNGKGGDSFHKKPSNYNIKNPKMMHY